jgi:ABC-type transport system substrate-binding protein
LLYRSLLQYSTKTSNIESDLASCNIENLLYIECVLENNLEWSNETPITPDDIVATLNLIKETKVNPILASLLEKTQIEINKNVIILKNETRDVNFLQVLLQPIIPKSIVDTLNSETV